jgi:allantoicase
MNTPSEAELVHVPFTSLLDLAAERVGGQVLYATDDFFAEKENLLKDGRGVFVAGKFTERGKWMDGWESRRKRTPGHDFCVVKLGIPGRIHGVDVDTHHFVGNFPESCRLEATERDGAVDVGALAHDERAWVELVPRTKLRGNSRNLLAVHDARRFTHLRLHIHPDGGVARLKVHGEVPPDPARLKRLGGSVDLAAAEHGGVVVACNDAFFGPKDNLILPGRAANMGEGWETRRRRGIGFDWLVVKLAAPGTLDEVVVDTHHFKGNYPDTCSLEGAYLRDPPWDFTLGAEVAWQPLLPRTKLEADHRHTFGASALANRGPFTHVRVCVYPDGGISRLRLMGSPE